MPLIGNDDEARKTFCDTILNSNYDFKGVVYHGLKKDKVSLEVEEFEKYDSIIKAINVSLWTISM